MAQSSLTDAANRVAAVIGNAGETQAPYGDLVVPSHKAPRGASEIDPILLGEVGTTGLRQYGGFVLEEWLPQLQGRQAAWVWREMMDNSPIVGAILFAIEWLSRRVNWGVQGGPGVDPRAVELVESCMMDLGDHAWGDVISEALSMVPYGWCLSEVTYKRRQGYVEEVSLGAELHSPAEAGNQTEEPTAHIKASSEFDDGMIGWRKISQRAQETLLRWHFDGYSALRAMEQIDWHGGSHVIPLAKSLLFRVRPQRGNPEGRSLLRNGYTSYYALKRIQQIEAIGIERDLAGIPMITPPEGVDLFSPGYAALLAKVQNLVQSVRRDEYEGIVMPGYGWEFKLVSAGGSRQIATDPVIRRYEQRLATSMLADFVMIGQDSIGSYAMVDVKSELFGMAIDALLDVICDAFNRQEIPRLLRLNGMDPSKPPQIRHGSAGRIDLQKTGQFLESLAMAGAPIPWSQELLSSLFDEAALPTDFGSQKPVVLPEKMDTPQRKIITTTGADTKASVSDSQGAGGGPGGEPDPPATGAASTVQKAADDGEDENGFDAPSPVTQARIDHVKQGTVVELGPVLRERQAVLSAMLEREILFALRYLGTRAYDAYQSDLAKGQAGEARRIVSRVMASLNIKAWIENVLKPVLVNHAARVQADTVRTIRQHIRQEFSIAQQDAEKIAAQAGVRLAPTDIAPQVRDAIDRAVREGLAHGVSSDDAQRISRTAELIREYVPAGRFTNAGSSYRARLIARDQTARAQNMATVAAYRSNRHVKHVRVSDGILADSDATCRARDGMIVPISEAHTIRPLHPRCTLSLSPILED